MKNILNILLFLCVTTSSVWSQVNFVAKASRQRVATNERFRVDFTMDKDGDNFVSPDFEGFSAHGPNQSTSASYVNGRSSINKTFTYFLDPQEEGDFVIKSASIEYKGRTYRTNPIKIKVVKSTEPKEKEVGKGSVKKEFSYGDGIYLVAEVDKNRPFINEAVVLNYVLYWDARNQLVGPPKSGGKPNLDGIWSQDIEIKTYPLEEVEYKGVPSGRVVVERHVLYPQKTGKLKIGSLKIQIPIRVVKVIDSGFGRMQVAATENIILESQPITINPKPLPSNPPEGFTGAVGQFKFGVSQTKQSLNANESLQLKVKVSGKGNLKLFELPKIKTPPSIEVYDPESKPSIRTTIGGMRGSLTDTYTLVPQFKGNFPIPNLKFSYFDPKVGEYKQLTSGNISINVLQGPVQDKPVVSSLYDKESVGKQEVVQENTSFKFIKSKTVLEDIHKSVFFNTKLYWLLLLLPLLIVPVVMLFVKRKATMAKDVVGSKARAANKLVKKYLSTAKKNLGNSKAFYESLERALHNYLKARLNIDTNEMNKERINELLVSRSIDQDTINGFLSALGTCEMARYTPSNLQTMNEDYSKASSVITKMDKQW